MNMYLQLILIYILINFRSLGYLIIGQSAIPCDSPTVCEPYDNSVCSFFESTSAFICACKYGFIAVTNKCESIFDQPCPNGAQDCNGLGNSVCDLTAEVCHCAPDYIYFSDISECWPKATRIFSPCTSDDQCQSFASLSSCKTSSQSEIRVCDCNNDQFVSLDTGSCIPLPSELEDPCNFDEHCSSVPNSFCQKSNENEIIYWGVCACEDDTGVTCNAAESSDPSSSQPTTQPITSQPTTETVTSEQTNQPITSEQTTQLITSAPTQLSTLASSTLPQTSFETTPQATSTPGPIDDSSTTSVTELTSTQTSQSTTSLFTTQNPTSTSTCEGIDHYGNIWQGMGGQTVTSLCPGRDTGNAIWKCGLNGNFIGKYPDYSDCSTPWLSEINNNLMESIANGSLDTSKGSEYLTQFAESLSRALESSATGESEYFGHEINGILDAVKLIVTKSNDTDSGFNLTNSEHFTKLALEVSSKVFEFQKPWEQMPLANRTRTLVNSINLLETSSLQLSNSVAGFEDQIYTNSYTASKDISIVSGLVSNNDNSLSFPPNKEHVEGKNSFIKLPKNWKNYVEKAKANNLALDNLQVTSFVGMEIDSKLLEGNLAPKALNAEEEEQPRGVNSKMMSFTIADPGTSIDFGEENVEVTMHLDQEAWSDVPRKMRRKLGKNEKPRAAGGTPQCVFFNATLKAWSTKGCKLVQSGPFSATCECNHLSSFAVLSQFHEYVGKGLSMELAGILFYGVSAFIMFTQLYSNPPGLADLHKTGAKLISLFVIMGNIMLILFIDKNYLNLNDDLCYLTGLFSHFLFMASFSFLLTCTFDGLINVMLKKEGWTPGPLLIFINGYKKSFYCVLIFGLPFIIVAITAATGAIKGPATRAYGGEFCWLDGSFVWAFYIPIIIMFSVNAVLLCYWKYFMSQKKTSNDYDPPSAELLLESEKFMSQNTQFLLLLGLTWFVGFYEIGPGYSESAFLGFLFPILNGVQGILLLMMNRKPGETNGGILGFAQGLGLYPSESLATSATNQTGLSNLPEPSRSPIANVPNFSNSRSIILGSGNSEATV